MLAFVCNQPTLILSGGIFRLFIKLTLDICRFAQSHELMTIDVFNFDSVQELLAIARKAGTEIVFLVVRDLVVLGLLRDQSLHVAL